MMVGSISVGRLWAMLVKEFIQMRRDRPTFFMIVGIPIMQLMLFGYAINSDPKHLPTAIVDLSPSVYGRSIKAALAQSDYFEFVETATTAHDVDVLLGSGTVQFVITLPSDLTQKIERGERPVILVEADATDPSATGNALGALAQLATTALRHDLPHARALERAAEPPIDIRVHRRYNPEAKTSRNIVPGLIGIVLTMTLVVMTALSVTRERERGTMETLLSMPLRPFEVMVGKIAPYVIVGYIQVTIILGLAALLFSVPLNGDFGLLSVALIAFIVTNLAIGFTISTIASNQLQAMQMSFAIMLPSILLSGFMFPFRGMPAWAQVIGEMLPATHFMRVIRGVLLKDNGWVETWPDLWPLFAILAVVTIIALRRYRVTLD
jgi:ABC-2 type transport system permease protein